MAEFSISGRMKVKTLKSSFKESFGYPLRVYSVQKFADDDATLASIRKDDAKGGEVKVNGNMLVGNFEDKIQEEYGIKVQVASPDDSKLVDNKLSISKSGQ